MYRYAYLIAFLTLFSQTAQASTVVALSLPQIVDASSFIAKVEIVGYKSRWNNNGQLVTDCSVRVRENVKGSVKLGELVNVVLLGGVDGAVGMAVMGEPQCGTPGDVVVLLASGNKQSLRPIGMAQGWYNVRANNVQTGLQDLERVQPIGGGKLLMAPNAVTGEEPVGSFLDRLRHMNQSSTTHGTKR